MTLHAEDSNKVNRHHIAPRLPRGRYSNIYIVGSYIYNSGSYTYT